MATLSLVVSTLLMVAIHFADGGTIIYPNGTTVVDFAKELKMKARDYNASVAIEDFSFQGNLLETAHDLHLSAQGNRIILDSPDIHLMCPFDTANISVSTKDLRLVAGRVLVDDLSLANNAIGSRWSSVAPNGEFFNFTTKTGNFKLGTENAGNLVLDAGPDHAVQISASRLDLQGASLNLTGTHVALDEIISQSLLINGTLITTTESDVDIVLSPKGNGKIRVGKDLDVRGVALILDNDQISGDKVEGGTIDAITITTLNATTINADFLGRSIALKPGIVLDVSSGVLQLADDQISGDKIKGGTIDETTITTLTSTTVKTGTVTTDSGDLTLSAAGSVKLDSGKTLDVSQGTLQVADLTIDNVKIDSNAVESLSGDLELKCPAGSAVRVDGVLAVNSINSTTVNANIVLSPQGMGAVKVAEGKTLDLRGVTLLIDNDAISGDKIDGGTIGNITVNELVGHLIKNGILEIAGSSISSIGDIRLSPAGGKIVKITEPLEVLSLKLDYSTIGTTTGQPVTINNLTCPIATFDKVTAGNLKIQGNLIQATNANGDVELVADSFGKIKLSSNVQLNSVTGTGAAIFGSVSTATVTTSAGSDLTLNPGGSGEVKIGAGKTLDVTGATLKLDDNAISGDKIEGGSIEVKNLRSDDISVSGRAQVNGSVEVGSGGVETRGGVRDGHAWGSETARRAQLALAINGGGGISSSSFVGGPMNESFCDGWDTAYLIPASVTGFSASVFDGRYLYFIGRAGIALRYDTQQSFKSSSSWAVFDASSTSLGNMKGYNGAAFDGRYIYFSPYYDGVAYHGRVLRYDTRSSFTSSNSWAGYDAVNVDPGNMKGFYGAVFDGRYVYFSPLGPESGRVLRYDTQSDFFSDLSWDGYDAKNTDPGNMAGFRGIIFDGVYIYFVASDAGSGMHGRVLRYDTRRVFTVSDSWTGVDASNTAPGDVRGFIGAVFDGRYCYFVPYSDGTSQSGKVLRYDAQDSFTAQRSWTAYDASSTPPGNMKGFVGAAFDGRYIYFSPNSDGTNGEERNGKILRYDTHFDFLSSSSWSGMDASNTAPGNMVGYQGTTFDGRYVYFIPGYLGSSVYHGRVLRYDTRSPQPRPSIQQIASNKDLFIASDSKVGIGTTTPIDKLHVEGSIKADKLGIGTSPSVELDVKGTARIDKVEVAQDLAVGVSVTELGNGESVRVEGGVMAKGGVRDSHAWGSEMERRVKLAMGSDGGGGYGSSSTVGGPMTADFFEAMDASATSPGSMKGFYGAVTDGRFVYFVPHYNGDYDGRVLRYDTQGSFTSSQSWIGFDAGSVGPGSTKGFDGGVFDGRYVYFIAHHDGSYHGRFLRYDSQGSFTSSNSWTGFDAASISPGSMKGFKGGTFDGRYLYFAPDHDGTSRHGKVLRYDTSQEFTSPSSWSAFDASSICPGNMKGFYGAIFDGYHVYFVPYDDGSVYHGRVLRYDTRKNFSSSSSWEGYDASNTSPGDMVGYIGASFDGRFIYFGPHRSSATYHGRVLRYDTQQSFTSSQSWLGYDAVNTSPGAMKGFYGTAFDGRYVYFVPYTDGSAHGRLLRYDTLHGFTWSGSWAGFDVSGIGPGNMKGFQGAVFANRYIYFSPYHDGTALSGKILRYDTRSPQSRPSIQQIATSSELFIASNGQVGIGTTDPGEKLTVEGGVMAKGGVRDSHAWGSETARRSQLALGGNGLGDSAFVGGPMNASFFKAYDASTTYPGGMVGFIGAVTDGRFVYFVPHSDGTPHGKVLRYDTQQHFESAAAWEGYDASNTSPGNMVGYYGACFDGRFIYFSPYVYGASVQHGRVLRFDTEGPCFACASSWSGFDAVNTYPGNMRGFNGAVFDSRYVYFVPYNDGTGPSGKVLRYDTFMNFTMPASWIGHDAAATSPGSMEGFVGAVFDGRYVYMSPLDDGSYHGRVLRLDTAANFVSNEAWAGFDASSINPGFMRGFFGAVFDSRYVYFVPYHNGVGYSGKVLRYDTIAPFTVATSWRGFDASNTSSGDMIGFRGGAYDGRYVYFIPYADDSRHGRLLRYDTHVNFDSSEAWSGIDAGNTPPGNTRGFIGGCFDGRHVYMAPYYDNTGYHGKVLRYDTRSPQPRPSIQQIASNKDLFIASDSKVGIGTTTPKAALDVNGMIISAGRTGSGAKTFHDADFFIINPDATVNYDVALADYGIYDGTIVAELDLGIDIIESGSCIGTGLATIMFGGSVGTSTQCIRARKVFSEMSSEVAIQTSYLSTKVLRVQIQNQDNDNPMNVVVAVRITWKGSS